MKKICGLLVLLHFLTAVASSQTRPPETNKTTVTETPQEATVVVNLLDLPGRNNEKSSWEFSYELRIIDQKLFSEAAKNGKLKQMAIDEEKSGDLIGKNSFRKENLSQPENRRVVLKMPLDNATREKLKAAQKLKHIFLFYGTALVFDGKLKKNIVVPLSWIWRSEVYPDAKFGIEFKIEESSSDEGYSYSRTTAVPEKLPKNFYVTGSPTSKP
ncbi:hypothetical protein BH20ACI4_BH20ACI4_19740 [soil metagenome]